MKSIKLDACDFRHCTGIQNVGWDMQDGFPMFVIEHCITGKRRFYKTFEEAEQAYGYGSQAMYDEIKKIAWYN
jgi:hypothetical protein